MGEKEGEGEGGVKMQLIKTVENLFHILYKSMCFWKKGVSGDVKKDKQKVEQFENNVNVDLEMDGEVEAADWLSWREQPKEGGQEKEKKRRPGNSSLQYKYWEGVTDGLTGSAQPQTPRKHPIKKKKKKNVAGDQPG